MTRILIIEDEIPAQKKLVRYIESLVDHDLEIVEQITTVEKAIEFLYKNQVDLIFSDIQLHDGNSFEIFSEVSVKCPIIFTTAYDQYVMQAFETNGIEYLLKPFNFERFKKAWEKFNILSNSKSNHINEMNLILKEICKTKTLKKRFTAIHRQALYFIDVEVITLFEADNGLLFAYDDLGKKHRLNKSVLKEIEVSLDNTEFYRINRSEIINKKHIEKIETYSKNVLAIKIKSQSKLLKTSQKNTSSFRSWLEL